MERVRDQRNRSDRIAYILVRPANRQVSGVMWDELGGSEGDDSPKNSSIKKKTVSITRRVMIRVSRERPMTAMGWKNEKKRVVVCERVTSSRSKLGRRATEGRSQPKAKARLEESHALMLGGETASMLC
jgi:hypothetical protein